MTDVAGLLDQINKLLQDFEHRMLFEQQTTREKVSELRDGLRDEIDTRLGVVFSEIDEIKAARDDLLAAVALVRGVQSELGRLAAFLDRSTPRRVARFSAAAVALSLLNLALLALHAYQMSGARFLSLWGG
jgi:hypothetical protein